MKAQSEQLILATREPDHRFYEALSAEMLALKASDRSRKLASWEPYLIGNLETVVRALTQVVENDWRENARKPVAWKCEYQLLRVTDPVDHVEVLTRLFSPPDPQSIFYGRKVARISENEFIAWVSD